MPRCDSSETYTRTVWLWPSPADLLPGWAAGISEGLPALVHEVSRRVWGLRLRRTEQELALSLLFMLPSAHYEGVGVRIASFRSWIPTPPILCLRFAEYLAIPSARLAAGRIAIPFLLG